jgi:hypothetical protein
MTRWPRPTLAAGEAVWEGTESAHTARRCEITIPAISNPHHIRILNKSAKLVGRLLLMRLTTSLYTIVRILAQNVGNLAARN